MIRNSMDLIRKLNMNVANQKVVNAAIVQDFDELDVDETVNPLLDEMARLDRS